MQRLVSIITRDGNGPLRITADRKAITHSDDHAELDAIVAERSEAGDDMVLILFEDDSVARHWTRPVSGESAAAVAEPPLKPQYVKRRKNTKR